MPEVGGECAEYIDPYNVNDIAEKIEKYITDANALNKKTKNWKTLKQLLGKKPLHSYIYKH